MVTGIRIKTFREMKNLAQRKIEKRSGLTRSDVSLIESDPDSSLNTRETGSGARSAPVQTSYDDDKLPKLAYLRDRKTSDDIVWASSAKKPSLRGLRKYLSRKAEQPGHL